MTTKNTEEAKRFLRFFHPDQNGATGAPARPLLKSQPTAFSRQKLHGFGSIPGRKCIVLIVEIGIRLAAPKRPI
jgi:hypothetical protein